MFTEIMEERRGSTKDDGTFQQTPGIQSVNQTIFQFVNHHLHGLFHSQKTSSSIYTTQAV